MIEYSFNYYTLIYAISVLITGVLVFISWRRKSDKLGLSFFYLSLVFCFWSFIGMIESSIVNISLKILLSKFDYIGAVLTPISFFLFSLYYNKLDAWISRRNIFLLSIIPFLTLILVFTNEYHGLVWNSYYISDFQVGLVNPVVYKYGPWFWFFHLTYSYLLLLIGSIFFLRNFLKLKKPHNYQVGVILIGVLIPLIANIVYISGFSNFPGLDVTRVAFSLTGVLFVISIFYWKFLDLVPIARNLLIEKMSDGIVVIDKNDRIVDINPAALNYLSFTSSANVLGKEMCLVFKKYYDFSLVLDLSRILKSNFKKNIKMEAKEIELSIEQLLDESNNLYGRLLIFRDITEIKNIENKLIEEKEMAQKYLDVANVILLALDKKGRVVMVNKKGLELSGFKKEEILGKNWFKTCLPRSVQKNVLSFFNELVGGRIKNMDESFENEIISKNGDVRLVAWRSTLIKNNQGKIIGTLSSGEDITKKREDEKLIKINTERLGRLFHHLKLATESAKIGIWDLNLKKNILVWDDQMYNLYGINKNDFDGTYDSWKKICHPEDLPMVEKELETSISKRTNFNSVFRILLPDKSIRYLKAFANVVYDSKNRPYKVVGVNFDVSEEKEMDRAKSEFVSLASHQLRTPLTAINWYTEMLLSGDGGTISEEQRSYLEEVHTSNRHMVDLVNSLLNVSRIELGNLMIVPDPVNLPEVLEEIVRVHRVIINSKKIKFSYKISKKIPKEFLADKRLLGIVFQNILSNAINYTPDKGSINLSLGLSKDEKNILFKVSDTGHGIPRNQQNKIFTKLFRADNAQKIDTNGSGLGLYIVKSIVDKSGGEIWFESTEGKGTTFYVLLPLKGMKKIDGSKTLL